MSKPNIWTTSSILVLKVYHSCTALCGINCLPSRHTFFNRELLYCVIANKALRLCFSLDSVAHSRQAFSVFIVGIPYWSYIFIFCNQGFRLDAAKHMWPSDIAAIQAKVHDVQSGGRPYFVMEVIDQGELHKHLRPWPPISGEICICHRVFSLLPSQFGGNHCQWVLLAGTDHGIQILHQSGRRSEERIFQPPGSLRPCKMQYKYILW